jgi:hypothetical protein
LDFGNLFRRLSAQPIKSSIINSFKDIKEICTFLIIRLGRVLRKEKTNLSEIKSMRKSHHWQIIGESVFLMKMYRNQGTNPD